MPNAVDPFSLHDTVPYDTSAYTSANAVAIERHPGYRLACPDVVEITFSQPQHCTYLACIDLDGRVHLGDFGQPALAGQSLTDARETVARTAGVDLSVCQLRLVEPRSQWLTIIGPGRGVARRVALQGNETLATLIAELNFPGQRGRSREVVLLRPNIAHGQPAEVFRTRLRSRDDAHAKLQHVILQAEDQIYFSEPFRSQLAEVTPHWVLSALEWFARQRTHLTPP